ncbi:protein tyrosine phosphatase family protein [Sphingorhabdus arenilitoris]|uniref:Protein tyrosine phosphatase family protein n=1 Tax=Sphingorhabdus arenilitoris TaxID=1490041 RepID=A0ABV8RDV5_9SPHN
MASSQLEQIFNFRRIDSRLTISGQPSEEQLALLRDDGVEVIVNLGLHSHEKALPDEPASCARLGLEYIHIPVAFDAPTEKDYQDFCEVMDMHQNKRLHVHCIVNARVTAFFRRYAAETGLIDMDEAAALLESVWRPGGVWADFLGNDERRMQDHKFCGRDYSM